MFSNISMAGAGTIITFLDTLLKLFGVEAPEGSVASAVHGTIAGVGLVWLVWGQLRRKDLVGGLLRK